MPVSAPDPRLPRHVAIVMDGNGRWAARRGLPREVGHRQGQQAVKRIVRRCGELGIGTLTLFAFSSENWRRSVGEVGALMRLLLESLESEIAELHEQGAHLRFVGDRAGFDAALRERMAAAEALTRDNRGLALIVALGYGGRWDIVEAARRIADAAVAGGLEPAALDEARFAAELALAGNPEPDLFIRTGGEHRLSNFLLWDLAYTELYFTDGLWPDFDAAALDAAFAWFGGRERRFGAVRAGA